MHICDKSGWLHYVHRFKEKDAFVGYQKDVAAAVIFQASNQLRKTCDRLTQPVEYFTDRNHLWQSAWENGLLGKGSLQEVAHQKEESDTWKEAVCCNAVYFMCLYYSIRESVDSLFRDGTDAPITLYMFKSSKLSNAKTLRLFR